jgi:hypothetical protein
MRESRSYRSVRGAPSNERPYRDPSAPLQSPEYFDRDDQPGGLRLACKQEREYFCRLVLTADAPLMTGAEGAFYSPAARAMSGPKFAVLGIAVRFPLIAGRTSLSGRRVPRSAGGYLAARLKEHRSCRLDCNCTC